MRTDLPPRRRGVAATGHSPRADRSFALLWAAAVLVPLLGVAGAGLASWQAVRQEAEARLERTVELLHQNALRAFGTQDTILIAAARAAAGREVEDLRGDESLHALLLDLSEAGGAVVSGVLVADAGARIVSASWEFPARPADLSDRDYVQALRAGGVARTVGAPVAARPMGWSVIPVARRVPSPARDAAEEAPPMLVVSSFNQISLTEFYASIKETPADLVAMFRDDGTVLARHPPIPAVEAEARREEIRAMLDGLTGAGAPRLMDTPLDGVRRLVATRRVGGWPVVVAYGLDAAALGAAWRERMIAPSLGGLAAVVLLLALTSLAQRAARDQQMQAESRAEAEAQLARVGRAAAIGLLAAGLAHDVKNLVQAVRSGTRVMQRRADDPEEVRRCAVLLGDAAERGGRLVDAMLAFARGGGGAPDDPAPPLDVRAALVEAAELLARTLGGGWPVRATLPALLPATRGDRAGFEAAVVNLAANAREAMPSGGTVTICAWTEDLAEPAEEAGLPAGRYVVAAVQDSGVGMDEATLARLGEPFFTTKGRGAGTGLGLATVRGFCARAGGALRFESSPGQGTTAAIWLPVA